MQNSNVEMLSGIKTLGGRVKKLRELKGWSQRELALKVNLSPSAIHKIEANKNFQTRKIVSLSEALGVEPRDLDTYDTKESNSKGFQMLSKMFPNWKELILNELHKV